MLASDLAHLGELGIADMRVMRPDHGLRAGPAMLKQPLQRVEHMLVAQIPRHGIAVIHHPVILLGRRYDARILLGAEKRLAVLDQIIEALLEEIEQGVGDRLLAHRIAARQRHAPVAHRV